MTDTEKRIAALIRDRVGIHIEDHPQGLDTRFRDLSFDSLDIVELTMATEEEFHVEITDDEMELFGPDLPNGKTVADLVAMVDVKVAGKVPAA